MLLRIVLLSLICAAPLSADFTAYIGDSNAYQVAAIATDLAGNTYVAGGRLLGNAFGAVGGYNFANLGSFVPNGTEVAASSGTDVFVTELESSGNIVFTTTFGGKGGDQANAIALDASGNIWVGGASSSNNFPLHDAVQTDFGVRATGFLVKLAADGTVIYSSYFGGTLGPSSVNGVATDQSGNVYVTGTTNSSDFPVTAGMPAGKVTFGLSSTSGAFIARLSSNGLQVIYSGLIVGNTPVCPGQSGSSCSVGALSTAGVGISVDPAGNAYIAGNTNTSDLPATAGALQAKGYGAFATKVNAAGSGLAYLTYLGPPAGPSETITATAIVVNASGDAYVTGYTNDPYFPATPGAFQTTLGINPGPNSTGAFIAQINNAGTAMVWASYLGGPQPGLSNSLSIDLSGNIWLAGATAGDFPGASPGITNGPGDFLAELKSDGSALTYSATFASGSVGQAIAVDASGLIHAAGEHGLISVIAPLKPLSPRILGIVNAAAGTFSGRLSPGELISIYGPGIGPSTAVSGTPDSSGLYPKSLGGVQVLIDGVAAPLLYTSSTQINAEVPFKLADPQNATISILNGSSSLPVFRASVDSAIPGIFTSGGSAAAVNQDGSINSATNPAKAGSIVSIWATGTGNTHGVDGQVATAAANTCPNCQILPILITPVIVPYISLFPVPNSSSVAPFSPGFYAGVAPGIIDGVSQINFTVPSLSNSSTNQIPFVLMVGPAISPTAVLYVIQ